MRLPEETPVRQAMEESDRKLKMSRGGKKFTWRKGIENDLSAMGITSNEAKVMAKDRAKWRSLIS